MRPERPTCGSLGDQHRMSGVHWAGRALLHASRVVAGSNTNGLIPRSSRTCTARRQELGLVQEPVRRLSGQAPARPQRGRQARPAALGERRGAAAWHDSRHRLRQSGWLAIRRWSCSPNSSPPFARWEVQVRHGARRPRRKNAGAWRVATVVMRIDPPASSPRRQPPFNARSPGSSAAPLSGRTPAASHRAAARRCRSLDVRPPLASLEAKRTPLAPAAMASSASTQLGGSTC